MCGIAGYIGQSKKPTITFDLITALFHMLETRGRDAAGVWATEAGDNGKVVYHKEPTRSQQFVTEPFWNSLRNYDLDLMLVHARATSGSNGTAEVNSNNHPFTTSDHRIGLIHNGTLESEETAYLNEAYETTSNTDSEYLLRIFEHGLTDPPDTFANIPQEVMTRITAGKEIWSHVCHGAMSVAVGERFTGSRRGLLFFRNEKRPLWAADLRQSLGQLFFFSSEDIWYTALAHHPELRKTLLGNEKLFEIPPFQMFYFTIDTDDPAVTLENSYRFNLCVHNSRLKRKRKFHNLIESETNLEVISAIGEVEARQAASYDLAWRNLQQTITNIQKNSDSIANVTANLVESKSITEDQLRVFMQRLSWCDNELQRLMQSLP